MSNQFTRLAAGFVGALALLVATPAAALAKPSDTATHCVTIIDKSRQCFTGADAQRQAQAAAAGSTLLMIAVEHADWGGVFEGIYGNYGPCDGTGYKPALTFWVSHNISSFYLYNGCNRAFLDGPYSDGRYFYADSRWIGGDLSDHVTYIRLWHA